MTPERRAFLENNIQEKLTEDEIKQGYHFCYEFDGLLIGPQDPEWECCLCGIIIEKDS